MSDRLVIGGASGFWGEAPHATAQLLSYPGLDVLAYDYLAEIGPGVPRRENRKFCQVTIDLKVPQGWSYSVGEFDYRGLADLDRGVTATQTATYYFDRNREGSFSTTLQGAINKNYTMSDDIDFEDLVWSNCNQHRLLNIKSQIQLRSRNRRASGLMTVDTLDGKVRQIYGLKWRRC